MSPELDPLWSVAYSEEEFKAAVGAAEIHDVYVTVHAYTDRTVNTVLDAGVKCLEHSQLSTEETVKRIADEGIFWSINWVGVGPALLEHPNFSRPAINPKLEAYLGGLKDVIKYIKIYKPKVVHNVDTVLSTVSFGRQHRAFEKYYASKILGNHAFLVSAASTAGELAQLGGRKNPYPHKLGVIEAGA
ncbi:hypothetical protein N9195_00520 [bacterium]|nr:hypothetical protein [bacterium]